MAFRDEYFVTNNFHKFRVLRDLCKVKKVVKPRSSHALSRDLSDTKDC